MPTVNFQVDGTTTTASPESDMSRLHRSEADAVFAYQKAENREEVCPRLPSLSRTGRELQDGELIQLGTPCHGRSFVTVSRSLA